MTKLNEIQKTDKFQSFAAIMDNIYYLEEKHGYSSITNDIRQELIELMGNKYLNVYDYLKNFSEIKHYSDKFFDCEEKGFSYELGCRYLNIKFDYPQNVEGEINWLKDLLKIYNPDYKEEIRLILSLINNLYRFKEQFEAIAIRAEV